MYCATNYFPELPCCGPKNQPYGVHILGHYYHMHFDPKLVCGTCEIHLIPCACTQCMYMLDQLCTQSVPPHQQPCYHPVKYFTYCTMLGSFNNWNIIQFLHKAGFFEDIDKIHPFVIDGIGENMSALVKTAKYCFINIADTKRMVYYVIKFTSESYTLREDTTCGGNFSLSGEIVFRDQYINCMQDNTKWYWGKSKQQDNIIFQHSQLFVHDGM